MEKKKIKSKSNFAHRQRFSLGEYNAVGRDGNRFESARAEIMARVTIIRFTNGWRGTYHRCYRQICTCNAIPLEFFTWVIVYLISLLTITVFPFVCHSIPFFYSVCAIIHNHSVCVDISVVVPPLPLPLPLPHLRIA